MNQSRIFQSAPANRTALSLTDSDFYRHSFEQHLDTVASTKDACEQSIAEAINLVEDSFRHGGKVLFCGNGGSAADCQHLAAEFIVRLSKEIERPSLGAISLCTDPSVMTAGGNDIGFENVFARSVEGLGKKGDVLVVISTSGNSENLIRAVHKAKSQGLATIGLLGSGGGRLGSDCDVSVIVPSDDVQRIQEMHILLGHVLCQSVESRLA